MAIFCSVLLLRVAGVGVTAAAASKKQLDTPPDGHKWRYECSRGRAPAATITTSLTELPYKMAFASPVKFVVDPQRISVLHPQKQINRVTGLCYFDMAPADTAALDAASKALETAAPSNMFPNAWAAVSSAIVRPQQALSPITTVQVPATEPSILAASSEAQKLAAPVRQQLQEVGLPTNVPALASITALPSGAASPIAQAVKNAISSAQVTDANLPATLLASEMPAYIRPVMSSINQVVQQAAQNATSLANAIPTSVPTTVPTGIASKGLISPGAVASSVANLLDNVGLPTGIPALSSITAVPSNPSAILESVKSVLSKAQMSDAGLPASLPISSAPSSIQPVLLSVNEAVRVALSPVASSVTSIAAVPTTVASASPSAVASSIAHVPPSAGLPKNLPVLSQLPSYLNNPAAIVSTVKNVPSQAGLSSAGLSASLPAPSVPSYIAPVLSAVKNAIISAGSLTGLPTSVPRSVPATLAPDATSAVSELRNIISSAGLPTGIPAISQLPTEPASVSPLISSIKAMLSSARATSLGLPADSPNSQIPSYIRPTFSSVINVVSNTATNVPSRCMVDTKAFGITDRLQDLTIAVQQSTYGLEKVSCTALSKLETDCNGDCPDIEQTIHGLGNAAHQYHEMLDKVAGEVRRLVHHVYRESKAFTAAERNAVRNALDQLNAAMVVAAKPFEELARNVGSKVSGKEARKLAHEINEMHEDIVLVVKLSAQVSI